MMDAGVVLGAVGLYRLAIDSIQFICNVIEFPEHAIILKVKLELEGAALRSWGDATGIGPPSGEGHCALDLNESAICNALIEMHTITASTSTLKDRYNLQLDLPQPTPYPLNYLATLSSTDVVQKRSEVIRGLGRMGWVGRRFRWAIWDRHKFEELVRQLHQFNQTLFQLVSGSRHQELLNKLKAMELRKLLPVNPDAEHQLHTLQAASESSYPDLSASAKLRIARIVFDEQFPRKSTWNAQGLDEAVLDKQRLSVLQSESKHSSFLAGSYGGKPVVVEWKNYGGAKNGPMEASNRRWRIAALVHLLGEDKPEKLRTLRCCGYFDDAAESKFCLVFEFPIISIRDEDPSMLNDCWSPISLEHFIRETRPSLSTRIVYARQLAESLLELLAVGWYHKALRPQNVIWFRDTSKDGRRSATPGPFLLGFEYSRPDNTNHDGPQMSEGEPRRPEFDIYHHPSVIAGEPFRPEFDIYSFGLVLSVIAKWKMIDAVEDGTRDNSAIKLWNKTFKEGTKHRKEFFRELRFQVGDVFAAVIEKCILGQMASDVDDNSDLRFEFFEHVYKPLQQLTI
jgi:hypothetical protein